MGGTKRCGKCSNCATHFGESDLKKRKRLKLSCTAVACGQRTEAGLLSASTCGGKFRGHSAPFISRRPQIDLRDHPLDGHLAEKIIDESSYNKFLELVQQIKKLKKQTTVEDIKLESVGILNKLSEMTIRSEEVDYAEAIVIATRIMFFWVMGSPVGRKAFTPPIEEAEQTSNVLNLLVTGALERERILKLWEDKLGTHGRELVADILSRQTPKANQNIPLINCFLDDLLYKLLDNDDIDFRFWTLGDYLSQLEGKQYNRPGPCVTPAEALNAKHNPDETG